MYISYYLHDMYMCIYIYIYTIYILLIILYYYIEIMIYHDISNINVSGWAADSLLGHFVGHVLRNVLHFFFEKGRGGHRQESPENEGFNGDIMGPYWD